MKTQQRWEAAWNVWRESVRERWRPFVRTRTLMPSIAAHSNFSDIFWRSLLLIYTISEYMRFGSMAWARITRSVEPLVLCSVERVCMRTGLSHSQTIRYLLSSLSLSLGRSYIHLQRCSRYDSIWCFDFYLLHNFWILNATRRNLINCCQPTFTRLHFFIGKMRTFELLSINLFDYVSRVAAYFTSIFVFVIARPRRNRIDKTKTPRNITNTGLQRTVQKWQR